MTFNTLYSQRKKRQQKKLAKYLRYVLNDHFTLLLFFLFGGFLYFYSQLVKTLNAEDTIYLVGVGLLSFFVLFFGNLATFMEKADSYFLLAKEKEFPKYFRQSFYHSWLLPSVVLAGMVGITVPLFVLLKQASALEIIAYFFLLVCLKGSQLLLKLREFYTEKKGLLFIFYWVSAFFIAGALSRFLWLVFVLGILLFVVFYRQTFSLIERETLNFELAIEQENQRQKRILNFIALFTDVPEVAGEIKRRKYLDFLLARIPKTQKEAYTYLFARRLLRGQEYYSLFLSLSSLGGVLMLVFQSFWPVLMLCLVFIYLLGFQLLPLQEQFQYMTMTKLYPVSNKLKEKSFQKILFLLLISETLFFSLLSLLFFPLLKSGLLLGILLGESVLFSYFYGPQRLKKQKQRHFSIK